MEVYSMKKMVLLTAILMLILGLAGCSKEEKSIDADEVSTNTLLAKSNGELQVATVEDFDKSYYSLNELEEFVAQEINTYNQKAGAEKIKIDDVLQHGSQAIMILTYSGMDQYANFNKVAAAYFNGGIGEVPLDLPTTLISADNGSLASTQEIIQNDKFKILVLNEPYDVIVDGDVKYYSENSMLLDDNKVQSAAEGGMTVIVFR
jgi:regulator of RNase E activity RraB